MKSEENFALQVANIVRKRREASGLTQTQAAHRMGMQQQNWSKYETGFHRLRIDQLPDVAAMLGCTPADLLEEFKKPTVKIMGSVHSGGVVRRVVEDDDEVHFAQECPPMLDPEHTEALFVSGDALLPIEDGSVVYLTKRQDPAEMNIVGRLCLVELADGRLFFRQVRRGYLRGRFNLTAGNASPIEDAEVISASTMLMIGAPDFYGFGRLDADEQLDVEAAQSEATRRSPSARTAEPSPEEYIAGLHHRRKRHA